MVQRSVEAATQSSTDVQQSVFASVDSVAAFNAAASQEQEQSRQQMPRLAELQLSSSSAGKTSPGSKKKLMSMAFQVQKRRREAAAAAAASAATATEASSNADTVSSSDTETSPAHGHDYLSRASTRDQSSLNCRQPQADDSCSLEHSETACAPATEAGSQLPDDVGGVSTVSVGSVTVPPKTLIPASTQPASLMTSAANPDDCHASIDILTSPVKLVPPVDPQHIHAIAVATIPDTASDELSQPDMEDAEDK